MKISDEELKKNRQRMLKQNNLSTKLKRRLQIYKRYFKNRGGYIFLHFVFTLIILIAGETEKFFTIYLVSVIGYEGYVYSLREQLKINKD